jgi:cobaltochelatase CobN
MNLAVKKLTGKEPAALISDVRDPNVARVRRFEEVLDSTFRTELLNRDWIRGMKSHDYAGAGHIAELVKNTFGWQVTRRSAVTDGTWNEIYDTYVQDKYGMGLPGWFDQVNPHARQELTATMLEAARKGYWAASGEQLAILGEAYASSVARYGPSAGLVSGGNAPLQEFVTAKLNGLGKQPIAAAFTAAMAKSAAAAGTAAPAVKVAGQQLQPADPKPTPPQSLSAAPAPTAHSAAGFTWWPWALAGGIAAVFLFGMWRRTGGIA